MSIITKYRPMNFESIIGQSHVMDIKKKCAEKQIPNAFLFTGVHGTGKTTTARLVAMSLNSPNGVDGNPDLSDLAVKAILSGTNSNVKEIDMASNRGIEDVRSIQKELQYSTVNDGYRVYILDEAHQITKAGASALLKSLEEPPKNTLFILCTTDPQKLLKTIRSRCTTYDFKRVTSDSLYERLKYICEQENKEFTHSGLEAIVSRSSGSVRDAESVLSKYMSADIIDEDAVAGIIHEQNAYSEIMGYIEKGNKIGLLKYLRGSDDSFDDGWLTGLAEAIVDHAIKSKSASWALCAENLVEYIKYMSNNLSPVFVHLVILKLTENFKPDAEFSETVKSTIEEKPNFPIHLRLVRWFDFDFFQMHESCIEFRLGSRKVVYFDTESSETPEGDGMYIASESDALAILQYPKGTDPNILIDKDLLQFFEE